VIDAHWLMPIVIDVSQGVLALDLRPDAWVESHSPPVAKVVLRSNMGVVVFGCVQ